MKGFLLHLNGLVVVDVVVVRLVCVLLHLLLDDEGLREEHHGGADQSDHQEQDADDLLGAGRSDDWRHALLDGACVEGHVDHVGDDGGRGVLAAGEVGRPLGDDHPVHVAEEHEQEDDLGHELEEEVHWLLEVARVQGFHADTKTHLQDTKNDGDLHLERVHVSELVATQVPCGVDTDRVHAVRLQGCLNLNTLVSGEGMVRFVVHLLHIVATFPDPQRDGHEVVVD